jgi:hypothetical protein
MKKNIMVIAGLASAGLAYAENLEGVDRMVCAAADVQICIEYDTCYSAAPVDLGVPEFVVIDTDKKTISTTRSSNEDRSTTFNSVQRDDGLIYLQGVEGGRAFSFVIDEESGRMTVAVSRDGMSVSVFGACTDAKL